MFNADFYPTPVEVIEQMGIDCLNKIVLEPSAGKGDIVEWLLSQGAREVLICEKNKDLADIVKNKGKFLKADFLKVKAEEVSHIDLIVMNPPFSKGAEHILHAWDIAPSGSVILSLINSETVSKNYYGRNRELDALINNYGSSEELGECFKKAERKTNVSVSLVKLFKPVGEEKDYAGFFMDEDDSIPQGDGIMKFDIIRDIVQRYVYSLKCFDEFSDIQERMTKLTDIFDVKGFYFNISYDNSVTTKEDFAKELQKKAWKHIFSKMNMNKYVTSNVMKDINAFVEDQKKIPFTMKNIYKMFEIIVGTREQTFNRSLVDAIDTFTRHTHENRFNVSGWKTNSGHMLNKKFIVECMVRTSYQNTLELAYYSNTDKIEDLIKVICWITGKNYNDYSDLRTFCRDSKLSPGVEYDYAFFKIKGFKKGTMHLKFKDDSTWELLNRKYAKIKGEVLPEKL